MLRSLSAAGMAAVLLFSMAAYGQDTGKKAPKPKSAKELKTVKELNDGLAAWAKYREMKIKELDDFVKGKGREGYEIGRFRELIEVAEMNNIPSADMRAAHNALVAFYNKELPKYNRAVSDATKEYNDVVAKYNKLK